MTSRKRRRHPARLPDLFAEREDLLISATAHHQPALNAPSIGIPRMLYVNDFLPFFQTFFAELGYRVVLSERTNRTLINRALEATVAETCFPGQGRARTHSGPYR